MTKQYGAYGNVRAETLNIAGTEVTATAIELNKLDGVASTATEIDYRALTATLTLGTAGQVYIVSPYTGSIAAIYTVINGALDTANEVLTVKTAAGTAGTITIAHSGSAAGDIDSLVPTSNNAIAAGANIEIETGGENGQAAICTITILIDIT